MPVSDSPLLEGHHVTLLPSGGEALAAIFTAIRGAQQTLLLEYYTFDDVHWQGQSLVDLLVSRLREGLRVALNYDGAGCFSTPPSVFQRLQESGAALLEFRPFKPWQGNFSLHLNDRNHRKMLVVDGRVAFLGGCNLSRVYENPASAGAPTDPSGAFWYDTAVRIEGPAVREVASLFFHDWRRHGGGTLPMDPLAATLPRLGPHSVRVDGSAPRERRQLYFESLRAAVKAARSHIMLSTGYFVPTRSEWLLLANAAERGVTVDLILAGYSDLPSCTKAARALYGPLLSRGVRIHELHDGMLHGKVATIDGVWTAIGSSNLDRRSYQFNNEIDAIILGGEIAASAETMLRDWMRHARSVSLAEWQQRSLRERVGENVARAWSRLM